MPRVRISIHAPREGSDWFPLFHLSLNGFISIHAPREGSDLRPVSREQVEKIFQSTLPVRGATYDDLKKDMER